MAVKHFGITTLAREARSAVILSVAKGAIMHLLLLHSADTFTVFIRMHVPPYNRTVRIVPL